MNNKSAIINQKAKQQREFCDQPQFEQTETLKQLQSFNDKFKKIVMTPIASIEAIQQSKLPQRCQQHNNAFSLYCVFDRKPLCVSCAYNDVSHKKHQVLPLQRSQNHLKQDSKGYQNKVEQVITTIHENMKRSAQNLISFQRTVPKMIYQITKFYSKLKEMINQNQQNQIKLVTDFKEMVKKQHIIINQQLKSIIEFFRAKLNSISKLGQQQLIVKRNIAQALSRTYKIFPKQLISQQKFNNLLNSRQYDEISDVIRKKIHLSLKLQNYYANSQEKGTFRQKNVNEQDKKQNVKRVKFECKPVTARNERANQKQNVLNKSATNFKKSSISPRKKTRQI